MKDEILNEKFAMLKDVVTARLRFMSRWNNVSVVVDPHGDIAITWYDGSNDGLFERIIYPMKSLDSAIKTQKRKLLRDIPGAEKEVYREVLC